MAKSIVNQITQIQKEATPGTALITAMRRLTAIGMRPSWNVDTNDFRAQGYKAPTVIQTLMESGSWEVDGIQDFNHLGFPLSSRVATPVTTTPATGVLARQHVFSLVANAEDTKNTYTAQFGDSLRGVQASYGVFDTFGVNIQRASLGFDTSFISRTPAVIGAIATAGVTTVAASPTAARKFDIWSDATWAALGTTQLLAAYEGNLDLGSKFAMDTPINSAVTSYESLLEAEDQSYEGMLRLGFDATAAAMVTTYETGALKFFRIKALGPLIETTIYYSLQLDFCASIRSPGALETYSNGILTLPFDFAIVPDPTTGNMFVATLVNTILAY